MDGSIITVLNIQQLFIAILWMFMAVNLSVPYCPSYHFKLFYKLTQPEPEFAKSTGTSLGDP